MSNKHLSRRDFLRFGCLTTAAAGLAVCGFSAAIPIPQESEKDLPSISSGNKDTTNRILVAFASRLGSTAEIALTIGKTLAAQGFPVDLRPIQDNPQITDYQAVLLGSAVRYGNWLPEAAEFVKTNRQELNNIPVALFTVQITNLGNDLTSFQARRAFVDQVRPLLHPVDEAFFAGKFDRRGAAVLMPGLLARLVPSIDFRNFKKVDAWASIIHQSLFQQA